jgi:hypothetical protein
MAGKTWKRKNNKPPNKAVILPKPREALLPPKPQTAVLLTTIERNNPRNLKYARAPYPNR